MVEWGGVLCVGLELSKVMRVSRVEHSTEKLSLCEWKSCASKLRGFPDSQSELDVNPLEIGRR